MSEKTPEQRADEAAEELAASGEAVTARAVRQRSGVRMTVAAEAARVWNERRQAEGAVPVVPETLVVRVEAIWREAYTAARAEFDTERAGWQTKLEAVEAERSSLTADIDQLEGERDQARTDAATAIEELGQYRSRADRAEASVEALQAELERVRADAAAARERADAQAAAVTEQRSRADRAEARAQALEEVKPKDD
ncbi:DNA-binding protein [Enemella sp. A6]|uniref:DNA-binding protein n=1 Tax=Enemella sp. A6 TaxID=3440152 RepID=UPI003EBFB914